MSNKKLSLITQPTALTIAIVQGRAEAYDRFRFAYQAARKTVGSQRDLAKELGVHPSALARSNFTLTTARRRQAAALCGVPLAFLQERYQTPRDLPKELLPLHGLMKDIRQLVTRAELTGRNGWSIEARLTGLQVKEVTTALSQWPTKAVEETLMLMQAAARRSLEQLVTGIFSANDWLIIVESLVHHSLATAAENLQNREFIIAKNIHRLLSQEKFHETKSSETESERDLSSS